MLIGVVGKPSTGKSTFFRASTLAEAEIANYPFTTIKPNHAVGFVRVDCVDKEFNKQCIPRAGYCVNHNRFVPVELLDVAGLVPGAHEGLGMGNKFLDDLRQADVLIHVVDVSGSTNEKGEAVQPLSYDPIKDVEFLERELDLLFFSLVNKGWDKFAKQQSLEKKELYKAISKQLSGLGVSEGIARTVLTNFKEDVGQWNSNDLFNLSRELRKITKPIIIAANKVDVKGADENVKRIKEKFPDYKIVECSAIAELALREAAENKLIKYLPGDDNFEVINKLDLKTEKILDYINKEIFPKYGSTGIQKVLDTAVFDLLKYIAIYPGGVNNLVDSQGRVLPDCFLMKEGSTALDFAFKLHTDFGKSFIRAINVKTRLTIGKDYKLKHKDVIEIISGK